LPKAHVEAPTTASMLLAALLLKFGTGGFFRFLYVLKINFFSLFLFISFLGTIMSCILCIFQSDLKSLSAYSSINHIRFLLIIIVLQASGGVWCSLIIILVHGLVSLLIFYLVGEYYIVNISRIIYFYGNYFRLSIFINLLVFFCLII